MNENPTASDWAAARGEKWREQVARMEPMLAQVDTPLIQALDLHAPCRIAEIGCGGGGTTLELLKRAPLGSLVHGFDISPALIELARTRTQPDPRNIRFELADMATAKAPEVRYDRLVSRFGIMFFDDPLSAFKNLNSWLAPGGRFAFAAWGNPEENPWVTSVRKVVMELVEVPKTDPDGPGPFRYAEADKFLQLLTLAGFADLRVKEWRGMLPIGGGLSAAEAANFGVASFSNFEELLMQAGDGKVEKARQILTQDLSRYEENGIVSMSSCVHLFTGSQPKTA
jgi:SAM-dependent methyltransferase